jgi:hypothetical protein
MKTFFALVPILIAAASLMQSSAAGAEATYAERLGWAPKARVVLFHCDDAGMSHASNLGAIESIEKYWHPIARTTGV